MRRFIGVCFERRARSGGTVASRAHAVKHGHGPLARREIVLVAAARGVDSEAAIWHACANQPGASCELDRGAARSAPRMPRLRTRRRSTTRDHPRSPIEPGSGDQLRRRTPIARRARCSNRAAGQRRRQLPRRLGLLPPGVPAEQAPELLYNVGQAADRLRMDHEALAAFRLYLKKLPDADNRREVENRVHALEERLGESSRDPTRGRRGDDGRCQRSSHGHGRRRRPDVLRLAAAGATGAAQRWTADAHRLVRAPLASAWA